MSVRPSVLKKPGAFIASRRPFSGLLALLTLLVLSCGQALSQPIFDENSSAASRDIDSIVARGLIRVAITSFDLPGFHWKTPKGDLVGPEIQLARNIGRLLNVGVQFVDDCPTFDAVIDAVISGKADIGLSKLSQTPRRIRGVRFSEPYFVVRQALLFDRLYVGADTAQRPPEDVLRQFEGTIGVVAHSSYVDFAHRNFPMAQIMELQTWEAAVDALAAGRVEAIYRDEFEIRRVLENRPAINVRAGTAALTDQKSLLSVAICASCVRLREFINYLIIENQVSFTLSGLLASARTR